MFFLPNIVSMSRLERVICEYVLPSGQTELLHVFFRETGLCNPSTPELCMQVQPCTKHTGIDTSTDASQSLSNTLLLLSGDRRLQGSLFNAITAYTLVCHPLCSIVSFLNPRCQHLFTQKSNLLQPKLCGRASDRSKVYFHPTERVKR